MRLQGVVASGKGSMAALMTTGPDAGFYAAYFGHMVPGTFNVRLAAPYRLVSEMTLLQPSDGARVLVERCRVENLDAFLITTPGDDAREADMLTAVSAFPLRRFLRLVDGNLVTVTVADTHAYSQSMPG